LIGAACLFSIARSNHIRGKGAKMGLSKLLYVDAKRAIELTKRRLERLGEHTRTNGLGLRVGPLDPARVNELIDFDRRSFDDPENQYADGLVRIAGRSPHSFFVLYGPYGEIHGYLSTLFFRPGSFINHDILSTKVASRGYLPSPDELVNNPNLVTDRDEISALPVDCYIDAIAVDHHRRDLYFVSFLALLAQHFKSLNFQPRIANAATIAVDSDTHDHRDGKRLAGAHWAQLFGLHQMSKGFCPKRDLVRIYYGGTFRRLPLYWNYVCAYVRKRFPEIDVIGEVESDYNGVIR
jgi:hypothetical protein